MAKNQNSSLILGVGRLVKSISPDARTVYESLRKNGIIPGSIKNFGRFSDETKQVFLTVTLALHDAGLLAGIPPAAGIVYTSPNGALLANEAYFRDYLDCGQKLARGNLFIYTLPTSPLAETAICFALKGPLFYTAAEGEGAGDAALREARSLVAYGEAPLMLAVTGTEQETTCLVVGKNETVK